MDRPKVRKFAGDGFVRFSWASYMVACDKGALDVLLSFLGWFLDVGLFLNCWMQRRLQIMSLKGSPTMIHSHS